jgi:hypothetical protein
MVARKCKNFDWSQCSKNSPPILPLWQCCTATIQKWQSQSERHHSLRARRYRTPWILRHPCTHHTPLLVALHGQQHRLVCKDLSYLSNLQNTKHSYPPYRRHSHPPIRQNIRRHNAPPPFKWLQVHHTGTVFSRTLPRIRYVTK